MVKKCVGPCTLPEPLTVVVEVMKESDVRQHMKIFDPEFLGFNGRLFRIGIKLVNI